MFLYSRIRSIRIFHSQNCLLQICLLRREERRSDVEHERRNGELIIIREQGKPIHVRAVVSYGEKCAHPEEPCDIKQVYCAANFYLGVNGVNEARHSWWDRA